MSAIDPDIAGLRVIDVPGDIGANNTVAVRIEHSQRLVEADAVAVVDLALEPV